MWRALSSSASSACSATWATRLGPRLELAAQHLARQRRRGRGEGARHLLLQRVELLADRADERADLRRRLRGEALLEAFERDQAVAVAVLVARLARRAQLLRVQLGRVGRRLGLARCRPGGRRRRETSPNDHDANELSSSRGMKRE